MKYGCFRSNVSLKPTHWGKQLAKRFRKSIKSWWKIPFPSFLGFLYVKLRAPGFWPIHILKAVDAKREVGRPLKKTLGTALQGRFQIPKMTSRIWPPRQKIHYLTNPIIFWGLVFIDHKHDIFTTSSTASQWQPFLLLTNCQAFTLHIFWFILYIYIQYIHIHYTLPSMSGWYPLLLTFLQGAAL